MDEKRPKRRKDKYNPYTLTRKRGQAFSFLSGRTRYVTGITDNKRVIRGTKPL